MCKNMLQPDRYQMAIQYVAQEVRFACRTAKARMQIDTHNI